MVAVVTLEKIRASSSADRYPCAVLDGCETALVLFAAAFHGAQDALWIADAGLTATCVDVDKQRLHEMANLYPEDWTFVDADVFEYATTATPRDVVSLDPPSNLFDKCAELLPLWCLIARKAVILGTGKDTVVDVPDGWYLDGYRQRSHFLGGVFWAVLKRC